MLWLTIDFHQLLIRMAISVVGVFFIDVRVYWSAHRFGLLIFRLFGFANVVAKSKHLASACIPCELLELCRSPHSS